MFVAAENGRVEVVQALATLRPELVMIHADNGQSCMFIAALEGHVDIVKYLAGLRP